MPSPADRSHVVRLTDERLRRIERRLTALDARLDATNARLDEAVDVLIRLVRVVAAEHARIKTSGGRMDRLARDVGTGRTSDVKRLAQLEKRLASLERKLPS